MMAKVKSEFGFEEECGDIAALRPQASCGLQILRPQERQLMRPWLWDRLEKQDVPGMFWVDKEKLQFRIPWKHGSRQGWEQNKDAVLFQMWAEHTGKFRRDDERSVLDPKTWKATFRCALNSLPDVEEVPTMSEKRGANAYRVYQFMEPKKSRKNSGRSESGEAARKTTRRVSVKCSEPMMSPPLKREYEALCGDETGDDLDDGISDTTDSGSEDMPYRPKRAKFEHMAHAGLAALGPTFDTCAVEGQQRALSPSFCTCGSENEDSSEEKHSKSTNTSNATTGMKEKSKQILDMYLKNKEVRKAIAQSMSEKRRMDLLQQKLVATQHWVQMTQHTTTVRFPEPMGCMPDPLRPTPADCSQENKVSSSTSRTPSAVSELAQRCREGRSSTTSPLPNVETLTRKNRFSPELSIPIRNLLHFDLSADATPPRSPNYSTAPGDLVSSSSAALLDEAFSPAAHTTSPTARLHHPEHLEVMPSQLSPSGRLQEPPTYYSVTAAKENQVVMTPPGSTTSHPSGKDTDRDTSSPCSDLSDQNVISMVDDMMDDVMTMRTTVRTTLTAAPVDYLHNSPVDNPSFCQLFTSSSQLLLSNGGCSQV